MWEGDLVKTWQCPLTVGVLRQVAIAPWSVPACSSGFREERRRVPSGLKRSSQGCHLVELGMRAALRPDLLPWLGHTKGSTGSGLCPSVQQGQPPAASLWERTSLTGRYAGTECPLGLSLKAHVQAIRSPYARVQLWDTSGLQRDLKHRDQSVCPALTPTPTSHTGSIWGNEISSMPGGHSS